MNINYLYQNTFLRFTKLTLMICAILIVSCSSSDGGQTATAEATVESLEQTEVIFEPSFIGSTATATDAMPAPTRLPALFGR